MATRPPAQKPFDPDEYQKPLKEPGRFQAHVDITGELGDRALHTQRRSGLTAARFVTACIQYALDHMETK